MTRSMLRRAGVVLAIAGIALAVDQWTKMLVEQNLGPGAPRATIPLLGDWFALEYAQNRGAAFGLFPGASGAVATAAALVLAGVVVYALRRPPAWLLSIGAGLVVGGAVGNLIDRVRLGYVTDFIAVGAWPNFNVADAAVT
ncbi:MAG: signal peptidase II, partial [Thermomicrobiales bacterium]|nr:signal peptidase II [Thermomicrobiales bacterium]